MFKISSPNQTFHILSARSEMLHELGIAHCLPADNIVPLYTYCEDPPCLAFQYMENGTLHGKLENTEDPLTWRQRANIAIGIARGLYHLHTNNVVHGDIKGQNILLDKHLEPKIGDFGTNRLLYSPLGDTISVIKLPSIAGTPYYLPSWYVSHQNGKMVRKQIDVYSYGMVILEIMSGKLQGDKWRDSNLRTLREFVNNDIPDYIEPPSEYIANGDDTLQNFQIIIETDVDGRKENETIDTNWAQILFRIGRSCTIFDKAPWDGKDRFGHPKPWKTMEQYDITMKSLYEQLEGGYRFYRIHLGENVNENDTDSEEMAIKSSQLTESDFLAHEIQSQQMNS